MNVVLEKGGIIKLPQEALEMLSVKAGNLLECTVVQHEIRLHLPNRKNGFAVESLTFPPKVQNCN